MPPLDAVGHGRVARYPTLHRGHVTKNDSRIHWRLDDLRAHCRKPNKGTQVKIKMEIKTLIQLEGHVTLGDYLIRKGKLSLPRYQLRLS